MTRTAADVQAEIEAVDSDFAMEANELRVSYERAWVQHRYADAGRCEKRQRDLGRRTAEAKAPLVVERDHLARAELDAATPPGVRATALRLRAAHRSADGWAMGVEDPWDVLPTAEAKAWAAVAREAGQ